MSETPADKAAPIQFAAMPPPFLNKEFMKSALQEYEKDKSLEVTTLNIVPAGKPGDNFASIVFRASVAYTSRGKSVNASYIIKVEPFTEGFQKEMMGAGFQFETEISMYTKTLPAFQHLLKSIGDPEIIAPDLIYASLEPKIIILQDVTVDNFVMVKAPHNLDTVERVLLKLAKFHALSYFLANDSHDETIVNYNEPFVSETMKGSLAFVSQMFDVAVMVLQGWGKEMESIVQRLTTLKPTLIEKILNIYSKNETYNVLCHGDFHVANLLFKWKEDPEKVAESIRFIDFQFCFYGTPAVDIYWSLYFVASTETRDNHREELIKLYHKYFVDTLNKLGFLKPIPSLLDLNVELLKNGLLEAYAALGPLPMFFMDLPGLLAEMTAAGKGPPSMEDMMTLAVKMMEEPKIKTAIQKLLPRLLFQCNFEA